MKAFAHLKVAWLEFWKAEKKWTDHEQYAWRLGTASATAANVRRETRNCPSSVDLPSGYFDFESYSYMVIVSL